MSKRIPNRPLTIEKKCFSNHMGLWLIEPMFFQKAFQAAKSGLMPILRQWDESDADDAVKSKLTSYSTFEGPNGTENRMYQVSNGIALISMYGPMMKGDSKFGDVCSTVQTRLALRQTLRDPEAKATLLIMDSPGGTVAGTEELGNDVSSISSQKPVHAHVEDMSASANYWIASQCASISANATALVGSLGTLSVVEDTSKKMEMEGTTVHVVSTGPMKGSFTEGAPVTEEQLKYLQGIINDTNMFFMRAVADGRKMDIRSVNKAATGEMYIAGKAKELGLIDNVRSSDETLAAMNKSYSNKKSPKASIRQIDLRLRLTKHF